MRDAKKLCGLTVHQRSRAAGADGAAAGTAAEHAAPHAPDAPTGGRLGPQCHEFAFRDPSGDGDDDADAGGSSSAARRRKQAHQAPADYRGRAYLSVPSALDPFSVFVWYQQRTPHDPDLVCVDVAVDGKRSPGWILRSGRRNGVSIEQIMHRGKATVLEFSPAKASASAARSSGPALAGTIEAKFWRVMHIEGGAVAKPSRSRKSSGRGSDTPTPGNPRGGDGDGSNDEGDGEDDDEDEDSDDSDEDLSSQYIPDEGLPALCVLTLHYRDAAWLAAHHKVAASRHRQALGDATNSPRTPGSKAKRPPKKAAAAAAASASAAAAAPDTPQQQRPVLSSLPTSELSTALSSPVVSKHRQIHFSALQSSPMRPPRTPLSHLNQNMNRRDGIGSAASTPDTPKARARLPGTDPASVLSDMPTALESVGDSASVAMELDTELWSAADAIGQGGPATGEATAVEPTVPVPAQRGATPDVGSDDAPGSPFRPPRTTVATNLDSDDEDNVGQANGAVAKEVSEAAAVTAETTGAAGAEIRADVTAAAPTKQPEMVPRAFRQRVPVFVTFGTASTGGIKANKLSPAQPVDAASVPQPEPPRTSAAGRLTLDASDTRSDLDPAIRRFVSYMTHGVRGTREQHDRGVPSLDDAHPDDAASGHEPHGSAVIGAKRFRVFVDCGDRARVRLDDVSDADMPLICGIHVVL
ncbi:hypothetical protein HK105_200230 [Polyrhizophydium stewartii]|uniref:Uncharacterized protein n=1 Tax=Polyrhizophydium stewartii TaxID=2732419 RepID=A0ABR4NL55_9FUNG|nr:hypothetical protein HK105_000095 [Polyrhizophydium stewartii]